MSISEYDPRILEAKARDFLISNHPAQMKKMSRKEIDQYCQDKAARASRSAENLMSSGVPEPEAWNRAIRTEILESETD